MQSTGHFLNLECHGKMCRMNSRSLTILLVTLPLAALFALLAWGITQPTSNPGGLLEYQYLEEEGIDPRPTPDFSLRTLDGTEFVLSSARGKIVMIDFWSSWCPPCIIEAPIIERAYRKYQNRDITFVGISIWDLDDAVKKHVGRFGLTYPNGIDKTGHVAIDYGVRGVPEKHFIDRQGRLVYKIVGPVTDSDLDRVLLALLEN